jgi:thiol:disulfide interchange protein
VVDNGGLGWGILGCCIPIVGLVLWLVWKDQKPRTAKAAGIGALVAVGLGALYYVLIFMLGIGIVLGS